MSHPTPKWAYDMHWIKPKPYDAKTYEPPVRPLAYVKPPYTKPCTIEQLREIRVMREQAGKEGKLLPPLPCPMKPCMSCDKYREYWDKKLAERLPHNLKLL